MKHFEIEINEYLDGELEPEAQTELFGHLSACADCRNIFNGYLILKKESAKYLGKEINSILGEVKTVVTFPVNGTKKAIPAKSGIFYKIAAYTSAAAAALLFFLYINLKPEINYLKKEQVRVDTVFVPKEKIIIKTVIQKEKNNYVNPEANQKAYLTYISTLPQKEMVFLGLPENKKETL